MDDSSVAAELTDDQTKREEVPSANNERSTQESHEPDAVDDHHDNTTSEGNDAEEEVRDLRASCDRCDQRISGTRYKCQSCPDFDYCADCFTNASLIHPGHSFTELEGHMPPKALEENGASRKSRPGPNFKLIEEASLAVSTPSRCTSCAPVAEPLAALPWILKDPKVPQNMCLRWRLRISKLIEATQSGCAFCCYCLNKFFGPSNGQTFAYRPDKPWYAEPSRHDEQREDLVSHCMKTLTRLQRDVFEFAVTPVCTRKGFTLPDFDRLEISLEKETEKIHNLKDLRGVFNSAGKIEVKLDAFVTGDDPAAGVLSSRPPNPSPASPETMARIRSWMKICDEQHGSACKPSKSARLPTRLVDVSGETLRLHETDAEEHGRYTTLSYCWGGPQEFCTTSSTLSERLLGFSCQDLPQTLQDAVRVTQELGIQYLWVDSLCIVQDNEEDKLHQVSSMVEVYKNAYLTICAAGADEATKGFLDSHADAATGLYKALVPMAYPVPNKDAASIRDAFEMPKQAVGTLLLLDEDVKFSRSFSDDSVWKRGWCLQERILSPRFLSYGRWATWRCNREAWSDGGFYPEETRVTLEERRLVNNLLSLPDKSADLFTVNQLQQSWYGLVNNYTKRILGLSEDRLPAIGGIAAQISRITGVEYMAGLWKNNLLHDLMWYADTRDWLTRPGQWRAPSWSWASVECPVSYGDITADAIPLARVLECKVTPAPQNAAFGQIAEATLRIEGPFAELIREDVLGLFESQNLGPPPPKSNSVSEWYRQMMDHIQNQPKQKVSKEETEAGLPDKVYGMITYTRDWKKRFETTTEKTCYFGLLLREVNGNRYERIGAFFNEDAEWLDQTVNSWAIKTIDLV